MVGSTPQGRIIGMTSQSKWMGCRVIKIFKIKEHGSCKYLN